MTCSGRAAGLRARSIATAGVTAGRLLVGLALLALPHPVSEGLRIPQPFFDCLQPELDHLADPGQDRLGLRVGRGVERLHRPLLLTQLLASLLQGRDKLHIIQPGSALESVLHVPLIAGEQRLGNRCALLNQGADFFHAPACKLEAKLDLRLRPACQVEADIFTGGFDAEQSLPGQAVLRGKDGRPRPPQQQGNNNQDRQDRGKHR
jgi:hypothetical protein